LGVAKKRRIMSGVRRKKERGRQKKEERGEDARRFQQRVRIMGQWTSGSPSAGCQGRGLGKERGRRKIKARGEG